MIGSSRRVRVFAYAAPADMRKGYDGLSLLVRRDLKRDPLSGEMYLFTNRRRNRAKVLLFDGTGLCTYCKRLDKGTFARLWRDPDEGGCVQLTSTELALFLEGSELVGRISLSPSPICERDLAPTISV